jgi:hypothetical protein
MHIHYHYPLWHGPLQKVILPGLLDLATQNTRLAAVLPPIGALVLLATGPAAITAFSVLHGAGNGLLTIAKGTLPLAIFGSIGYGHRSGVLGAPARATQAPSPLIFGILIDHLGADVLVISADLCLSAFVALLVLRALPQPVPAVAQ